jgi:hypothetical protein
MTGELFDRVLVELGDVYVHRSGRWIHADGKSPGAGWVRRRAFIDADPVTDQQLIQAQEASE